MGGQNKKRKIRLWNQDPHCHWCGCLTELICDPEIKPGQVNPKMATVDHLRTKYDPNRWTNNNGKEERTVLACFKCNNDRAAKENASRPIEDLQRRGKGFRLNPGLFTGDNPQHVEQVIAGLESFHRIPIATPEMCDKVLA
jgi:hypothetical protein